MVISSSPIGEYDRRVELLCAGPGRISAFARGARKPGSSLVSVTRVFAFGEFTLYQGKSSYTLKSAAVSHYFDELSRDLDRTAYGFYFLEAARYFSRENVESTEALKLLYYSLRALSLTSVPMKLVRCIYELKLLEINGLCPAPDRIASGTGIYGFAAGMSPGCMRAYRYVLSSPVEKLFAFALSDEVLEEFSDILRYLMGQSVDRPFKSLALLDQQKPG